MNNLCKLGFHKYKWEAYYSSHSINYSYVCQRCKKIKKEQIIETNKDSIYIREYILGDRKADIPMQYVGPNGHYMVLVSMGHSDGEVVGKFEHGEDCKCKRGYMVERCRKPKVTGKMEMV